MIRNRPSTRMGPLPPVEAAEQADADVPGTSAHDRPSADEIAWLLMMIEEDRVETAPYFTVGADHGRP